MTTFTGRRYAGEGSTRTVAGTATIDGEPDESRLIEQARSGDTDAFGELYARHVADVASLARRLCRDQYEADDVVSDVFCNTLRALRAGGGPSDDLKPYLLRSVRNTIIKTRTRSDTGRADPAAPHTLDRVDGWDPYPAPGEASVAFTSVSDRYQRVLWSVEVEGTPTAAVAKHEDVSAPAAASLAYRARCALRRAYIGASIPKASTAACQPIRLLMPTFVDGGLGAVRSAQVVAHGDSCRECRQVLDDARRLRSGLSDRAWFALAPLGLRALIVNMAKTLASAVAAAPVASTLAAVSGTAALTIGVVAATGPDDAPRDSIRAVAAVPDDDATDVEVGEPSALVDSPGDPVADAFIATVPTGVTGDAEPADRPASPDEADARVDDEGADVGPDPTLPASDAGVAGENGPAPSSPSPESGSAATGATSSPSGQASPSSPSPSASAGPTADAVESVGGAVTDIVDHTTDVVDTVVAQVDATVGGVTDAVDRVVADVPVVGATVDVVTDVVDDVVDAVVQVPVTDVVDEAVAVVVDIAPPTNAPAVTIVSGVTDPVVDVVGGVVGSDDSGGGLLGGLGLGL